MKSAILAAILKNGVRFKNVLYTVDVHLLRAFQRYITCPDIPTRSEVKRGRGGFRSLVHQRHKSRWSSIGLISPLAATVTTSARRAYYQWSLWRMLSKTDLVDKLIFNKPKRLFVS